MSPSRKRANGVDPSPAPQDDTEPMTPTEAPAEPTPTQPSDEDGGGPTAAPGAADGSPGGAQGVAPGADGAPPSTLADEPRMSDGGEPGAASDQVLTTAQAGSSGEASATSAEADVQADEAPSADDAGGEGETEDDIEGDGDGPSADESLSVEMAAGRVQQPPQQRRSRQRGVRAALATLPVPEPGPSFWADLDAALADQQPLAIASRPAIRPITEPPPLSQPKLSDYLESTNVSGERVRRSRDDSPGSDLARPPGRAPDFGLGGGSGRGRKVLAAIVVIVLGLLVAGTIMGDGDDEPATSTGEGAGNDDQATTTAPPVDAAPTTPPAVPGLEPEARLTAAGIGPLQVGQTLGEINAAGVTTNVDQPTFDASAGACFDARPAGAADLTLRIHGPEPGVGVADPGQGVLGAVSISDVDGSLRVTTTEVGLGATEELVRDAHAGALEVSDNPSRPGGHVYLARSADDPDLGIAYATDGRQVTEISVGEVELIGVNQACA